MIVLGQAGTSAAVAYDFLVSMGILTNTICYIFMFAAYFVSISNERPAEGWRPPGGRTMGMLIGGAGMAATLVAIVCTLVPSGADHAPMQTFLKLVGSAGAMVGTGVVLFWLGNRKAAAA